MGSESAGGSPLRPAFLPSWSRELGNCRGHHPHVRKEGIKPLVLQATLQSQGLISWKDNLATPRMIWAGCVCRGDVEAADSRKLNGKKKKKKMSVLSELEICLFLCLFENMLNIMAQPRKGKNSRGRLHPEKHTSPKVMKVKKLSFSICLRVARRGLLCG